MGLINENYSEKVSLEETAQNEENVAKEGGSTEGCECQDCDCKEEKSEE